MNYKDTLTLEKFNNLTCKQQAFIFEKTLGDKRKYTFHTRQPKKLFGKGIIDVSFPTEMVIEGKRFYHPAYRAWRNMLLRSYYPNTKQKYKCSVCEEWHKFSSFLAWWWDNAPNEVDYHRWHLDKDSLANTEKVYCPDYCSYVPYCVNLMNRVNSRTGKAYAFNFKSQ